MKTNRAAIIAALCFAMALSATAEYYDVTGRSPTSNNSVSNLIVYGDIVLANTVWDDLRFPANIGTRGPSISYDADSNAVLFADSASTNNITEMLYGIGQLPHRYKIGTALHPHIHWIQTDANQTNNWYLFYSLRDLASTNRLFWHKLGPASNEFAFAGTLMHQYSEFPAVGAGMLAGISAIIDWRIARDGDNDTFNGDLYLKEFDIHYEADCEGSKEETSK